MELAMGGSWNMSRGETKRIKVSDKRQITIPINFFEELNIGDEVECTLENGAIMIRPTTSEDAGFATEILKDLVSQGYEGQELIDEFERLQKQIRPAVKRMIAQADETAQRVMNDPNYDSVRKMREIFGDLGDN